MNISSSISQVIYQTQLPGKILLKKAYLWPEYNAGKVVKVPAVHERAESAFNYIKRSSSGLTGNINNVNSLTTAGYSSSGNLINFSDKSIPGSIFEAFA
ncbi:MAG: hypothetical protein JXN64_11990 [Spirochaetes bacterium]|nr:hypothetical protein [Spirochaetota bacterium]